MSIGIMKPGVRVRHQAMHKQHDRWEGIVVEIETRERVGSRIEHVWVRWIKPCGDPSDSLTPHSPSELMPFDGGHQ